MKPLDVACPACEASVGEACVVLAPHKTNRMRAPHSERIELVLTRPVASGIEAAFNLWGCLKCGALRGDPCRSPSGKTTMPHAGRKAIEQP